MTDGAQLLCKDCGEQQAYNTTRYCRPCMGKRISKGKVRGAKRMHAMVRRSLEAVDIDAIHFNPRWKKIKQAA